MPEQSPIDTITSPKIIRCKSCGLTYRSDTKRRVNLSREHVEALLSGLRDSKGIVRYGSGLVPLGLAERIPEFTPKEIKQKLADKPRFLKEALAAIRRGDLDKAHKLLYSASSCGTAEDWKKRTVTRLTPEGRKVAEGLVR